MLELKLCYQEMFFKATMSILNKLKHSSGLLQNLLPGDTILADQGFDINDSVALYQASMSIPAFTRGKTQMDAIEVEQTRRIANVRIHVGRLIGNIRQNYSFLSAMQWTDAACEQLHTMTMACKDSAVVLGNTPWGQWFQDKFLAVIDLKITT